MELAYYSNDNGKESERGQAVIIIILVCNYTVTCANIGLQEII